MAVRIVTDSTSYLPLEQREALGITLVSLSVSFADGTTQRELDIDDSEFYKRLSASKEVPTSSQPAIKEVADVFGNAVDSGDAVVGVFISSDMSGTFETAQLARDMVLESRPDARIELVDSRSNCMQLGMCVLEAARVARAGGSVEGVVKAAEEATGRTRFLFTPHELDYLKRGGRIGGASALLGTLLQVRPILTVEDGQTDVFSKVRTKKRAMATIADSLAEEAARAGLEEVAVHHIDDEPEGHLLAELVKERIGSQYPDIGIPVVAIGAVIGLHVGPGTVGVVYRTTEPVRRLGERSV